MCSSQSVACVDMAAPQTCPPTRPPPAECPEQQLSVQQRVFQGQEHTQMRLKAEFGMAGRVRVMQSAIGPWRMLLASTHMLLCSSRVQQGVNRWAHPVHKHVSVLAMNCNTSQRLLDLVPDNARALVCSTMACAGGSKSGCEREREREAEGAASRVSCMPLCFAIGPSWSRFHHASAAELQRLLLQLWQHLCGQFVQRATKWLWQCHGRTFSRLSVVTSGSCMGRRDICWSESCPATAGCIAQQQQSSHAVAVTPGATSVCVMVICLCACRVQ